MSTARIFVRRTIMMSALATAVGVVGFTVRAASLNAKPTTPTSRSIKPSNDWLRGLKAKHKQFFDNPSPNGGIALVHV